MSGDERPVVIGDKLTVNLYAVAGVAEGRVVDSTAEAVALINESLRKEERRIFLVTVEFAGDELIDLISNLGSEAPPVIFINSIKSPYADIVDVVDVVTTSLMRGVSG